MTEDERLIELTNRTISDLVYDKVESVQYI